MHEQSNKKGKVLAETQELLLGLLFKSEKNCSRQNLKHVQMTNKTYIMWQMVYHIFLVYSRDECEGEAEVRMKHGGSVSFWPFEVLVLFVANWMDANMSII